MSLDRDLFIRTFGNAEMFEAGRPRGADALEQRLSTPARATGSTRRTTRSTANRRKFYKHNPAEAKALLSAAGITGAVETQFHFPVGFFAPPFDQKMEVLHAMLQDSGNFKLAIDAVTNYNANFQTPYTNGMDKWEGIAAAATAARAEVDVLLHEYIKSNQPRSGHLDNGQADAVLDDLVAKQRSELDTQKRGADYPGHPEARRVEDVLLYGARPGARVQHHAPVAAELRSVAQQVRRFTGPGDEHLPLVRRDEEDELANPPRSAGGCILGCTLLFLCSRAIYRARPCGFAWSTSARAQ